MWGLVLARMATLEELETHWSFDDLMRADEASYIRAELEEAAAKADK